ncbi:MAG: MBOAT family protein [Lachnospiraceae bacterium]|nr:MBOAT family protein [Lachnospiraceae bacterium]
MAYVSFEFLLFLAVLFSIYYIPVLKKYQWVILLVFSVLFYCKAGVVFMVFIGGATLVTYLGSLILQRLVDSEKAEKNALGKGNREEKKKIHQKYEIRIRLVMALFLVLVLGALVYIKYANLTLVIVNKIMNALTPGSGAFGFIYMIVPLGISFYSFQAAGYLIDVARGTVRAEKNIFKTFLFLIFFPQIVQGPISRFDQLSEGLFASHDFDFIKFKYGLELVIWGYFKKCIIADRAVIVLDTIMKDYTAYSGAANLFAVLIYALQLYADFSGGIDITRGVAEALGIDMIDNFRRPYFSQSINEYWTRWHISLGGWMKNYIFYPLSISKGMEKIKKGIKNSGFGQTAYGKHVSNVIPGCISTIVIFIIIGMWHGAEGKYIGFGLWNGIVMAISLLLTPVYEITRQKLHLKDTNPFFILFRILRTMVIILIGYVFDIAPSLKGSFDMMRRMVFESDFPRFIGEEFMTLFGTSEKQTLLDYRVLLAASIVLLIASIIQEKTGRNIREMLDEKHYVIQAALVFLGIMLTLIFGIYGPGYDVKGFVYMQF